MDAPAAELPEVLVYTTRVCAYCHAAKTLLREKRAGFREIDISGDDVQRDDLVRRTGQRTVPQIFIGDRHIGGFEELADLDRRGELDALLGVGK